MDVSAESKQSVLSRLRRAPGAGVTELRFGSGEHAHAVCHDGVAWTLHRLAPGAATPVSQPKVFTAATLGELIAFLDARWPLPT